MTHLIVTGGSGFIGRRLMQMAGEQNYQVTQITRHDVVRNGEITPHHSNPTRIADLLSGMQDATLIHLAGHFVSRHTAADIAPLVEANVHFATCVFDGVTQAGVKHLISAGTSWQFDSAGQRAPANLYAATKQSTCDLLDYFATATNARAANVILYDSYGPGDTRPKLIPLLKKTRDTAAELPMTSGRQDINLSHVDDIVDGLLCADRALRASPEPSTRTWSIRAPDSLSVASLVHLIQSDIAPDLNVQLGAIPDAAAPTALCHTISSVPDWTPKIALRDGLDEVFNAGGTS